MVYQIFLYIPIYYCFYHLHCGNMQSTQTWICVGTPFMFIILRYFNYCLILSLWQSIFSEKRFCQKFLGACHNLSVLYLILCFLWVKRRAFEHFFVGITVRAVESCSFRYLVFNFYNQFFRYRCKHSYGKSAQNLFCYTDNSEMPGEGGRSIKREHLVMLSHNTVPEICLWRFLEVISQYLLLQNGLFSCSWPFPFLNLHRLFSILKSLWQGVPQFDLLSALPCTDCVQCTLVSSYWKRQGTIIPYSFVCMLSII